MSLPRLGYEGTEISVLGIHLFSLPHSFLLKRKELVMLRAALWRSPGGKEGREALASKESALVWTAAYEDLCQGIQLSHAWIPIPRILRNNKRLLF